MQTLPLRQLLSRKSQLESEMKQLDSDMKTLVYENYAKFITATDTIRTMRTNVGAMEQDMSTLLATVATACQTADHIDAALREKREKLVRLSNVSQLLNKLKFVVDLPARLRTAVQMGAYAEAIRDYKRAAALIEKHGELPSFQSIRADCRAVMDQLRTTLCTRADVLAATVLVPTAPPESGAFADPVAQFQFPELCEVLKQLLELGDSQASVCTLYTDCVARLFVAQFAAAAIVPFIEDDDDDDGEADKADDQPAPEKVEEEAKKEVEEDGEEVQLQQQQQQLSKSQKASANITKFSLSFSVLMLRVFENFRDVFVPAGASADLDSAFHAEDVPDSVAAAVPCWRQFERFLAEVVELFFALLLKRCSGAACDLLEARRLFDSEHVKEAFTRTTAPELARLEVVRPSSVTVDQIVCASEAAQMPLRQLARQVCFLRIADKAHELAAFSLLAMVEAQFARMCRRAVADVRALREQCLERGTGGDAELFWSSVCDNALAQVSVALSETLGVLRPLNSARTRSRCGPKDAATTLQRVHIKAQQFFLCLETALLKYLRTDGAPTKKAEAVRRLPALLLALGGAAHAIGGSLGLFVQKIEQALPLGEGVQLIMVADLQQRFRVLAQRLLVRFVALESTRLVVPLRSYIEGGTWLRTKEPRDVGDGVVAFAQQLDRSAAVVRSFFANACFVTSAAHTPGSQMTAQQQQQQQQHSRRSLSLHRQEASQELRPDEAFGGSVDYTGESVRAALARACCKTAQECVRLCSFSRSGFQQLQVDLRYLRGVLGEFVVGRSGGSDAAALARDVAALLDAAESDARGRCTDPTPLEVSVIEHILKHSEASRQRL